MTEGDPVQVKAHGETHNARIINRGIASTDCVLVEIMGGPLDGEQMVAHPVRYPKINWEE